MTLKEQLRTVQGRLLSITILALLLLVSIILSLRLGSVEFTQAEILKALFHDREGIPYQIICRLRLPRILLGALVGGALAVSGTILQGVMRNPLASPGIIGVSAGGGLAGILVILALPQFAHLLVPAAFFGALGTASLVYVLAWKRGASPVRLILSGVAVAAMLGAVSSAVLLLNAEKAGASLTSPSVRCPPAAGNRSNWCSIIWRSGWQRLSCSATNSMYWRSAMKRRPDWGSTWS